MWTRRSVLTTGAALSIGTRLTSIETEATEADIDELPDPDRNPGPDEDWPSHQGGPGHARYIADGHKFEGGALEAAWSVESAGAESVAVADETVYTPTDDGVVALDVTDGTVVWENAEVDVIDPSVAGETVFFTGEEIVALDRSDGSIRWESDFGPGESIASQTVAYDGVYTVVDDTLYALEADDGSVRWKKETATGEHGNDEDEFEFLTGTAAANGVVYSVTSAGLIALEPETGAKIWLHGKSPQVRRDAVHATSAAVAYDHTGSPEWSLHDAQTGEPMVPHGTRELAFGEEIYVGGGNWGYGGSSIHGDEYSWGLDVTYTHGQAVISGETVFAYLSNYGERDYDKDLVALNKYDGSEKWVLSKDDAPVGRIRAISGETIYVDHDGDLVALREETDEENDDQPDESDENDDTDGGDDEQDGSDEENKQQNDGDTGEDDGDDDPADDESGSGGDDGGSSDDDGNGTAGNGDAGNETDAGNGTDTRSETSAGNETDAGSTDAGNETTTENNTDADNVPGFTTGGGLLGGALGLEWLRRKAGSDDSTSVNDPSE